jgi:RNA polymerase sigma-70 factor (ECF subfamily)
MVRQRRASSESPFVETRRLSDAKAGAGWNDGYSAADRDGAEIMALVAQRDIAAFEQLYDAYWRLVFGIGLRILGDVCSAEDLTESVFLTLWRSPDSFKAGNLGGWICRVARNRALDVLRYRSTHAERAISSDIGLDIPIDELVAMRMDAERLRKAMSLLPQTQRELLELGFFDGLTHEEIARNAAIPLGTAKSRIRAGIRRLRAALDKPSLLAADHQQASKELGPAGRHGFQIVE